MASSLVNRLGVSGTVAVVAGIVLVLGFKKMMTSPRGMLIAAAAFLIALLGISSRAGFAGGNGGFGGMRSAGHAVSAAVKKRWRQMNDNAAAEVDKAILNMMGNPNLGMETVPLPGGKSGILPMEHMHGHAAMPAIGSAGGATFSSSYGFSAPVTPGGETAHVPQPQAVQLAVVAPRSPASSQGQSAQNTPSAVAPQAAPSTSAKQPAATPVLPAVNGKTAPAAQLQASQLARMTPKTTSRGQDQPTQNSSSPAVPQANASAPGNKRQGGASPPVTANTAPNGPAQAAQPPGNGTPSHAERQAAKYRQWRAQSAAAGIVLDHAIDTGLRDLGVHPMQPHHGGTGHPAHHGSQHPAQHGVGHPGHVPGHHR